MERFFWTSDLKWARYLPGYKAENPKARNDRKFMSETCIMKDEIQALYIAFIAEYHKTPHRGLNFRTPAAVWDELNADAEFDLTQMPSPGQLREACGFYAKVKVTDAGIRYAGAVYSNEYTRDQRKAGVIDLIAAPGETIEIIVDPFDLGGISVLAKGEVISVPCQDRNLVGKSLRVWQMERRVQKLKAEAEAADQNGARKEAANMWRKFADNIMHNSDIGIHGYTKAEIERAAREIKFGKGQHEKPFIGRDEYTDPVLDGGFQTGTDDQVHDDEALADDTQADVPTSMDRMRSASKNRKRKPRKGDE